MTRTVACGVDQYEVLVDSTNLQIPAGILDENPICETGLGG
jgi:hypothetical protein